MAKTWTLGEVRALGARTDLVTACEIAYGAGRTKAYELHRRGELHFPALKLGNRIVVPVEPLLHFITTGEKWDPAALPRSSSTADTPGGTLARMEPTTAPTLTELIDAMSIRLKDEIKHGGSGDECRNLATALAVLLDKRASHEGIASRAGKP